MRTNICNPHATGFSFRTVLASATADGCQIRCAKWIRILFDRYPAGNPRAFGAFQGSLRRICISPLLIPFVRSLFFRYAFDFWNELSLYMAPPKHRCQASIFSGIPSKAAHSWPRSWATLRCCWQLVSGCRFGIWAPAAALGPIFRPGATFFWFGHARNHAEWSATAQFRRAKCTPVGIILIRGAGLFTSTSTSKNSSIRSGIQRSAIIYHSSTYFLPRFGSAAESGFEPASFRLSALHFF